MNKNLLAFSFILSMSFSVLVSSAQIANGTHLAGGSIGFNSQSISNGTSVSQKATNFTVSPSWGVAVKQNLIIGGDLQYGNSTTSGSSDSKVNSFGAGVFARKYHNLGSSGFYLFGEGRVGGRFSDEKGLLDPNNANLQAKRTTYNVSFSFQPGIAYAITPKLHLETGLPNLFQAGYSKSQTRSNNAVVQKQSGFGAGVSLANDFQWNIGFRFLWGS